MIALQLWRECRKCHWKNARNNRQLGPSCMEDWKSSRANFFRHRKYCQKCSETVNQFGAPKTMMVLEDNLQGFVRPIKCSSIEDLFSVQKKKKNCSLFPLVYDVSLLFQVSANKLNWSSFTLFSTCVVLNPDDSTLFLLYLFFYLN